MRAAIYARVSTANNGQNPEMQLRELREYCERRGLQVTGEYVEVGESLHVVRLDNERRADARVAWHGRTKDGLSDVGIELPNCDNFWELDWTRIKY